ncbi:MAG: glutathione S-transferase C-terminal domain-containing protein [Myxococcota bacterium]
MSYAHRLDGGTPSETPLPLPVVAGRPARPAPAFAAPAELPEDAALVVALGDAWGHALAAAHALGPGTLALAPVRPGTHVVAAGAYAGEAVPAIYARSRPGFQGLATLPLVTDASGRIVTDDRDALPRLVAPDLQAGDPWLAFVSERLVDATWVLRREADQGRYQEAWKAHRAALLEVEAHLAATRFLAGTAAPSFADLLLFAFLVRLDAVHYELSKANAFRLAELPALHGFARDLYERPELHETTDWDGMRRHHYGLEPELNPRGLLPRGGLPALDAPHERDLLAQVDRGDAGTEEDPTKRRAGGEWVRPQSAHRTLIAEGTTHPPEAGRYHLYAPYNCPWSHRALLGRAVKGLEEAIGASVVYFRRDPDHGWQFNAAIPGCTADLAEGERYLEALYRRVGSRERSAPLLWDTKAQAIVSNESADILRMLDGAFGDLATRDLVLVPPAHRDAIDRMNARVYQRINNGAYKAGFAKTQHAYARAFDRYFAMLDHLEGVLEGQPWLVASEAPTEADLRLFPTVFRHDPVYFTRFRLNRKRIADYPRLSDWLARMLAVPGVAEASNLDHARNGYFGRTGNGVVPMGPEPLGLSPADYAEDVWLNGA